MRWKSKAMDKLSYLTGRIPKHINPKKCPGGMTYDLWDGHHNDDGWASIWAEVLIIASQKLKGE